MSECMMSRGVLACCELHGCVPGIPVFACFSYHENAISPSRQPASAPLFDQIDNLDKTRDERTSSIMHAAPTFAVIMLLYLKHETPRLASSFPLFSSFAFSCSHCDYLSHSCLDPYEASFIKRSFLYKIVFLSFGRQQTCSAFELHAQICLISGPSLEPGNFVVIARYLSSLQLICEVYKEAAALDCSPRI